MYLHQPLIGDGQRDTPHSHRLRQYLLPHLSVASCRGVNKKPVLIGEVKRQPVILVLQRKAKRRQTIRLLLPGLPRLYKPLAKRFLCLDLIKAPQPAQVPVLLKSSQRLAPNPPCRRIGHDDARFFLHIDQLVIELIPLGIRHDRDRVGIVFC